MLCATLTGHSSVLHSPEMDVREKNSLDLDGLYIELVSVYRVKIQKYK